MLRITIAGLLGHVPRPPGDDHRFMPYDMPNHMAPSVSHAPFSRIDPFPLKAHSRVSTPFTGFMPWISELGILCAPPHPLGYNDGVLTDKTPALPAENTAASRIATFDLMRGYFLIVILVDHLLRHPSIFDPLTGRGLLWVSAAEGFFFISGLLIGLIRRRSLEKKGFGATAKAIWARAGKLYLASIILTLTFTLVGYLLYYQFGFREGTAEGLKFGLVRFENPLDLIRLTLNFTYVYGWADFLVYYTLFLLLAPLALVALKLRLWWLLVAGLLALWMYKSQFVVPRYFPHVVWSVYFFLGVVFGYHYHNAHQGWLKIRPRVRRGVRYGVVAAAVITLIASFMFVFGISGYGKVRPQLSGPLEAVGALGPVDYAVWRAGEIKSSFEYERYTGDGRGGLLRLPLFFLWFAALFVFVRRFEGVLLDKLGWLLVPLGQNSLYVYILQSVVVFVIPLFAIKGGFFVNTLINIAALALVWYAVKKRFLFRIIPR